jgi:GDP-L-fucose synthase
MTSVVGVLGHSGFVGKNLVDHCIANDVSFAGGSRRTGVDAREVEDVVKWIEENNVTHIINLAAECGGIGLNKKRPADLWLATARISAAVLEAARMCEIKKLIMVGTVCSYAKHCPVPFREQDLLQHGEPEETNQAYGVAKLSGLFGARAYSKQYNLNIGNLIPVNMYGPYDHFDLENSHVIPALIRKMFDAKESGGPIVLWGDGTPTREFLFARDFAEAALLALENDIGPEFVNIGSGEEISIAALAQVIADIVGYKGEIEWDTDKPNGQPRRCLDVSKANELLGFSASTPLEEGLRETVEWYASQR